VVTSSSERQENQMHGERLNALAARVEQAEEASTALVEEVATVVGAAFPEAAARIVADAALLSSTDAAIRVVDGALPAWDIALKGMALEPDGHWHCTLRRKTASGDEAFLGIGEAPSLPRALIAALLRVGAQRGRG
jgi:hypothetical protein